MPSYLLDTNAAIALLAEDQTLSQVISELENTYLSSIVLGELYYGAEKSARTVDNIQRVDELASRYTVLNCDTVTARIYGRVRRMLQRKGRPIQSNDIWIAATALQHNLALLTKDTDFANVDGLTVQSW
jgi:tRNA(fMet)-specific endonuclease VapC